LTALNDSLDGPRAGRLMRNFENEVLVRSLTEAGPVSEAPITLLLPSLRKGLGTGEQLFPNRHGSQKGTSGATEARRPS
jgi:hypothetical protein